MAAMRIVRRATRLRALRGAFREAEKHIDEHETLCVTVYRRLGVVDLISLKGRSRRVLARYSWDTNAEAGK